MRVLVTGGTGFLGSHLIRRLIADGATVTATLRPDSDTWRIDDLLSDVTLIRADLTDVAAMADAVRRCAPQFVFHLAGEIHGRGACDDQEAWRRSIRVNLDGTLNLLSALRQLASDISRIVRIGGMEEYGHGQAPFEETQREQAVSPYSASQIAATQLSHALAPHWNLPLVTVRPSIIYGPAQDSGFFIPGLIRACIEQREFAMTSGAQGCDFIYVDDVVDSLCGVATTESSIGEIINVGSGSEITVREVAELILRQSNAKINLKIGAIPGRTTEPPHRFMSIAKAGRLVGWKPSTGIESGLNQTIAWFRKNRWPE